MSLLLDNFLPIVRAAISRFSAHPPNPSQTACIEHPASHPLMIAAGPGSGKTTVLALRALRLVFVDRLLPEEVLVTTFTRKAAEELRSRLIEWGLALKTHLQLTPPYSEMSDLLQWLESVDINRYLTGTLDSLTEEVLTTHRDPLDSAPVLVEGFVGNALLARHGLFAAGAHKDPNLKSYLAQFTLDQTPPRNFGEIIADSRTLMDRLIFDEVNIQSYLSASSQSGARQTIANALGAYRAFMDTTNRMDFARLEEIFLQRIRDGKLHRFTSTLKAVLVDEYQDTNPLQESIYFELVRRTSASFTVVGDDDQSLYRFRGATVELFRDFQARFTKLLPNLPPPQLRYLVENYRSTPEIVKFFNDFIRNDPQFATARVQPLKPLILAQLPSEQIPILGMFRPDAGTLADELSSFLWDVFRGNGRTITWNGHTANVIRNPNGGDFGDAVVIGHTVNEYGPRWGQNPPRERLPLLMRNRLGAMGVAVFNPHGRALRDIPVVQQLLGILLECIDAPDQSNPDGIHQTALASPPGGAVPSIRGEAQTYLRQWRASARAFLNSNPPPSTPHTLAQFISAWQNRISQTGEPWPDEWPLLELCFKVMSWIPLFQDDPEGQVYLEAIARCISQAATYSAYRSNIVNAHQIHAPNSIRRAILDVFVPLAESNVEVDEDIMPHVPRERLPFLTIHQAKGLEYPLVIVDVSSDYRTNSARHRFRRFPEQASSAQRLEDDLAPFCEIGPLRASRSALARTFDDLTRLYYVAYSRPQSVLLLVGLDNCLQYNTKIKHVATGWRADDIWSWVLPVQPLGKKKNKLPALTNNIPLTLI